MTGRSSHPAVFAGLLGGANAGAPKVAAISLPEELADAVAGSLLLQFVVGCVAGAAIAGTVAFVADRISQARKEDDEAVPSPQDDFWSESSLNLVRTQVEKDDDPTGDLGRFRTGQITIDIPVLSASASSKSAESRRPRHSASIASAHVVAQHPSKRAGKHFASAATQDGRTGQKAQATSARRGRHFKGSESNLVAHKTEHEAVTPQEKPAPLVQPSNPVQPYATSDADSRAKLVHERLAQLPVIESRYAKPVPASRQASRGVSHTANDTFAFLDGTKYGDPVKESASASVQQPAREQAAPTGITGKLFQRIADRKRSVREVLADRLGGNPLDGVPIIARADGTVSDVAPSWFDQTLAPAIANLTGAHNRLADTAERVAMPVQQIETEAGTSRSMYISRHVAEVNEGMFPERRSIDDLKHEDAWDQALEAMSETIARDTPPVFQDMVGGPSTIDDPDGLEAPTGFIPFRVPAAHPEVVDTETYVDYLLRDELSHNGSEVLRKSSHAHLRVIEGGTSPLRIRTRDSEPAAHKPGRRGRHFASTAYVAEA